MSTPDVLVAGYEEIVAALTSVPAAHRELVLAKAVLLLAQRLPDPGDLRTVLDVAVRDLPDHEECV